MEGYSAPYRLFRSWPTTPDSLRTKEAASEATVDTPASAPPTQGTPAQGTPAQGTHRTHHHTTLPCQPSLDQRLLSDGGARSGPGMFTRHHRTASVGSSTVSNHRRVGMSPATIPLRAYEQYCAGIFAMITAFIASNAGTTVRSLTPTTLPVVKPGIGLHLSPWICDAEESRGAWYGRTALPGCRRGGLRWVELMCGGMAATWP